LFLVLIVTKRFHSISERGQQYVKLSFEKRQQCYCANSHSRLLTTYTHA